ncbi:MAG: DNA alkylation repair protein [Bdellovibrionia bacterium]
MAHKKRTNEANAFKNWIHDGTLKKWAKAIQQVEKSFNAKKLLSLSVQLKDHELKGRVHLIAESFHELLSNDYVTSLRVLQNAALLSISKEQGLKGFELWPLLHFIQIYGLDHFEESMEAIEVLTEHFSGEFAVRPYILRDANKALSYLQKWSQSSNEHLRRLSSEGSRPRLPWGQILSNIIAAPKLTTAILENLKYDSSLYVRKSVANHLNDISKDHPEFVLQLLKVWSQKSPSQHRDKIQWILRHSLRTLIKAGNPKALILMGVNPKNKIAVSNFEIDREQIKIGEKITFSFNLLSSTQENVIVDYKIYFNKAGNKSSFKVFKLKKTSLEKNKKQWFEKSHSFKPVTTRTLYPGVHHLSLLINGKESSKKKFILK